MINWEVILESLGLFGIAVGGLTWLVKTLGKYFIDRRLKAYEKELDVKSQEYQARLNTDLESHKAKLNIEHTQYQQLQERRLAVMAKLYQKITELDNAMQILILQIKPLSQDETPDSQMFKDVKTASDAYNAFTIYYLNHRIFFSEANCKLLDELKKKYLDSLWDATTRQRLGRIDIDYNRETLKRASETVREQIPEITAALEKDFRLSLGVK